MPIEIRTYSCCNWAGIVSIQKCLQIIYVSGLRFNLILHPNNSLHVNAINNILIPQAFLKKKSIFARTLLTNDWIFHGLYVEFAQTAKNSFQVALFDINFDHTNARWFTSYFLEFIIMVFHTTATGVMILIQNIFPGKKSCEKLYPGGPQSETVGI